ncbi:hypothetical protein GCM10010377_23160 [Streptomyces viridiviolaceus]|nr:hypothetical protein GCM10010377_23160 [Streptomyces viridiviolaceus]
MSVSDKPWLADRQPSLRGGVPQVTTGPDDVSVSARAHRAGTETVTDMYAAPRTAARRPQGRVLPCPSPLVADRAVDLLRVSSALCTDPGGAARCQG